jgi:hypothetical protein
MFRIRMKPFTNGAERGEITTGEAIAIFRERALER